VVLHYLHPWQSLRHRLIKRLPRGTQFLASPLELAVFVAQKLVEIQLSLFDIPLSVRIQDGGEDRRIFSHLDVELVGGFEQVFAGDAEFAWFLLRIREYWVLRLRNQCIP
jgi:hypothetical protein